MNPFLIKYVAIAAVGMAFGFSTAWKLQAANITDLELQHAEQQLSAELNARDDTDRQIAQVSAAQERATRRAVVNRRDADLAANAAGGLRLTTAAVVQSAAEDTSACPARAAALGDVFDQCVTQYLDVAEKADRHVSDAIEQHEANQ